MTDADDRNTDTPHAAPSPTSLRGRGRDAMVPERGLPFDVTRRRGLGDSAAGAAARLRSTPVAQVFAGIDWEGAAGSPAPGTTPRPAAPAHRQPANRFFATFPWDDDHPRGDGAPA